MDLEIFLQNNVIVSIGEPIIGYICTETIVNDFKKLIDILDVDRYYISEIRWWDCVLIKTGSPIGYGGVRDPRNPFEFFFAETDICQEFDISSTKKVYSAYIDSIKNNYINYNLYPAFDIKLK